MSGRFVFTEEGIVIVNVSGSLEQNPFKDLDTVVLMPHAGGVTRESSERSNRAPVDNVIAFLEGRPVNVVNP